MEYPKETGIVLSPAETLALAMSEKNKVIVNGKEVTENEADAHIAMSIRGAIMRAQGVTESLIDNVGWVKHHKSVEVKHRGQKEKITVPSWNAGEGGQTHAEWKADCIKSLKGQMIKLNYLRTNLAEVLAAPDAITGGAFRTTATQETQAGNAVENATPDSETITPAVVATK